MPDVLQLADARVDLRRGTVSVAGRTRSLPTTQAALLAYLVDRPGESVERDTLLQEVWGYRADVLSRAVDTAVRRVRRLIEPDPRHPRFIVTVHGCGYRYEPPQAEREATEQVLPSGGWRRFAGWRVSLGQLTLVRGAQVHRLTRREGDLLAFLLSNPRRVLDRSELRRRVWGYRQTSRVVDNAVRRLRTKLEADPAAPRHLLTVRGQGLLFDPDPDADVIPRGRVALVETWIEDAPARWRRGPAEMAELVARHDRLLQHRAAAAGAYEVRGDDDGLRLAFASVPTALRWSLAARRDLEQLGLPVAMAVAVGRPRIAVDAATGRTGYRGELLYEVRGLARAAHAGQVLASLEAWELGPVEAATATPLGPFLLAGIDRPVDVVQVDEGAGVVFPALRARSGRRGFVPSAGSTLVGRRAEVEALHQRVEQARWVTVVGPGGVGKTRLALEVAAQLLDPGGYPGGVWFVDLSGCTDPTSVDVAVARALSVGASDLDSALSARRACVLVLDNAEHLRGLLRRRIAEWLARAGGLRVLVTSRAPLEAPDEHLLPLGRLEPLEAQALFLARAQQAEPGFTADPGLVARIADELEGLPLALELTAARVRQLPVELIARQLTDHPGSALVGAVASSWGLLSRDTQDAWVRLGVFRGGFTLPAARAVLGASDPVFALLDHSLVHRRGERYDLYRAAAAWAWERPDPLAEQRHGQWCAELGRADALEAMFGPGGLAVRQSLLAELDNLVVAVRRAVERGDGVVAAGAVCAALAVLEATGPFDLAARLARSVLSLPLDEGDAATVSLALGRVLCFAVRLPEAELALIPAARHPRTAGAAGMVLGLVGQRLGRPDEARSQLQRAHVELAATGRERLAATCLGNLAILEQLAGELERAEQLYGRALEVHRRTGNRWDEGIVLHDAAYVPFIRGEHDIAARGVEESLAVLRETGNRRVVALALSNLCQIRAAQGRLDDVLQLRVEARLEFEELGNLANQVHSDVELGATLLTVEAGLARELLHHARAEALGLGMTAAADRAADLLRR